MNSGEMRRIEVEGQDLGSTGLDAWDQMGGMDSAELPPIIQDKKSAELKYSTSYPAA